MVSPTRFPQRFDGAADGTSPPSETVSFHGGLNYLPPAEYWAEEPRQRMEERKRKLEEGRKKREAINRKRLQAAA